MKLAVRRVNLSYVLHERSTSTQVDAVVKASQRDELRVGKTVTHMKRMSDQDLSQLVVVRRRVGIVGTDNSAGALILSLRLGAWPLVKRLFHITEASRRGLAAPNMLHLLDASDAGAQAITPLFRGDARLSVPAGDIPDNAEIWLVFAPIRPGGTSVHLEMIYLGHYDDRDASEWLKPALPWVEAALREHPHQWFSDRQVWSAPVEAALPEFIQFPEPH